MNQPSSDQNQPAKCSSQEPERRPER